MTTDPAHNGRVLVVSSPSDDFRHEREPDPMRSGLSWTLPFVAGAATGLAYRLIFIGETGDPFDAMLSAFILLVPVVVGVVTVYVAERSRRRSWAYYFWAAALSNVLFVFGTFLVVIEGLICTIVIAPLFAIIGGIAGIATGTVCRSSGRPKPTLLSVAALPLIFGSLEHRLPLPNTVDTVSAALVIHASPEQVWQAIQNAEGIRPDEIGSAWMYRIGVPLPLSAITEVHDGERVRHIEMGKGIRFDQVVVDWEPARRVRYTYRFMPDSFPPRALDDHVRIGGEYFDVQDTEYLLEPTAEGTRLTVNMSYRVSTHFNWYARLVGRFLVENFEQTALAFYARRAESAALAAGGL
jgi:uncharacterized protein YndB with AHSA1/START domain